MRKKIGWIIACVCYAVMLNAQIGVDKTGRYLVTKEDNKPFFWLGDTAWELFHRLSREEITHYLKTREKQGFNVIMAVVLAEHNGIKQPNYYGNIPFRDLETLEWDVTKGNDPDQPDEYDYWDHIDFAVSEAKKRNLYMALLPTWGSNVAQIGAGPVLFSNEKKAYTYTRKLAERYKNNDNIIWILGGDRPPVYEKEGKKIDDRPIWRAMASAIEDVCGKDAFITYHPSWPETSAYLNDEEWLDMHALQSGHGSRHAKPWEIIANDLKKNPKRPVMDLEPCYEDHPMNPWDNKWTRAERGYFNDYDVRARIYRGIFAGGCGAVYGHHQVWQFLDTARNPPVWVGDTVIGWKKALTAKAANHIHHLKALMLSRPDFDRIEDNSLVVSNPGDDYTDKIITTRNRKGTYAMIYLPQSKEIKIDLGRLDEGKKRISWFNPVTGKYKKISKRYRNGVIDLKPPKADQEDWVIVIDLL